ncbi:hypothetical protein JAAARDRAFT_680584 [Jaapia argillacea MUCL 33604]|uniref:Uncharacterized protein n=1 Tax=Jaapia argillacea MUCL 33604 TaxID=933084 RepID=A0A067Q5L3_9AGAM|nr:hypothetical protein JAAARDRAFT_680584 [Jaapia argillacea MUCL 33604]
MVTKVIYFRRSESGSDLSHLYWLQQVANLVISPHGPFPEISWSGHLLGTASKPLRVGRNHSVLRILAGFHTQAGSSLSLRVATTRVDLLAHILDIKWLISCNPRECGWVIPSRCSSCHRPHFSSIGYRIWIPRRNTAMPSDSPLNQSITLTSPIDAHAALSILVLYR